MANILTYRVLLAFFPFLIFLMSLLGFLNLDESLMMDNLYRTLPDDVNEMVSRFLSEAQLSRSTGLLSTSLLFTVYAVANGFRTVIHCINKAYDYNDQRGMVKKIGISILLMFTFTLALIVMLILLIFGSHIWNAVRPLLPDAWETLYLIASTSVSLIILTLATMFIYKLACAKKLLLWDVLPGAGVTVILWVLTSKGFSFFITNFTNYTRWYGSIASIFILILWLDIISLILLVGNQINSTIIKTRES